MHLFRELPSKIPSLFEYLFCTDITSQYEHVLFHSIQAIKFIRIIL